AHGPALRPAVRPDAEPAAPAAGAAAAGGGDGVVGPDRPRPRRRLAARPRRADPAAAVELTAGQFTPWAERTAKSPPKLTSITPFQPSRKPLSLASMTVLPSSATTMRPAASRV